MQQDPRIEKLNALLVSELGTAPRYAWMHSRNLYMSVQKIVTGENGPEPQYDYSANPDTGLIELRPVYINMPMLPAHPNSWVLCRFVPADQEAIFKQRFGVRVEYPRDGIWQPIMPTIMRPEFSPTSTDTWKMIHAVREERRVIKQFLDGAEEEQNRRDESDFQRNKDMFRDAFTAGLDKPGTKGSTSFFSGSPSEPVVRKETIQ